MFDMGFWEMVVIGIVALVVIGPERLPKVARIAGLWIGRARRTMASVQDEIRRELKADELKEILDKQARSRPLETIIEESYTRADKPAAGGGSSPSAVSAEPQTPVIESTTKPGPVQRETSSPG